MFFIDKQSNTPIYEQLIEQIEKLILIGKLVSDEQIPSVRNLSVELLVNPNTIQKAYNDLERREITYSVPGIGRFVSKNAVEILSSSQSGQFMELKKMAYVLALAGVDEQTILQKIHEAYKEAEIAKKAGRQNDIE